MLFRFPIYFNPETKSGRQIGTTVHFPSVGLKPRLIVFANFGQNIFILLDCSTQKRTTQCFRQPNVAKNESSDSSESSDRKRLAEKSESTGVATFIANEL